LVLFLYLWLENYPYLCAAKIESMQILNNKTAMTSYVREQKAAGKTVGFVPTMGALHEGHLTLVREAAKKDACVVVSIFVNPTQFNNKEDLKRYPRKEETDFALLRNEKCDAVFFPNVEEMYPETDTRVFDLGELATVMEGEFRPGHFNGVAQIVTKLFDIVQPNRAYFGKKDFQQLAVIQHITKQLDYDIDIVPVPTVRESDGLAMSSRNERLTREQREVAPHIYKTISHAASLQGKFSVEELEKYVINEIDASNGLRTEYFKIVNALTLQPVLSWHEKCDKVGCVAVYCGDVRLIDNISF
jgi:pantoate--beta-alanine ligase